MKRIIKLALAVSAAASLSACSSSADTGRASEATSLVRVNRVQVGDGCLSVAPPRPWNRQRPTFFDDIRDVEDWTLNGPYLDGISFVSGLKSGAYLIRRASVPTSRCRNSDPT